MNIIIPIGGRGERFLKTHKHPKPLIPIYGTPMIQYVLDHLITMNQLDTNTQSDYRIYIIHKSNIDICINTSKYDSDNSGNVFYIPISQDTKGAAETVMYGLKYIHSPFSKCVLIDCDTVYTTNILGHARELEHNGVLYTDNRHSLPIYSYITLDDNKHITTIAEKVKISHNANTGCYVFADTNILKKYCQTVMDNNIVFNGEPYMSCVISEMVRDKHTFKGIEVESNRVISLGTPSDLDAYYAKTYVYLFDLDGTLVVTDNIYFQVWTEILEKYGVVLDQAIFDKYICGNDDKYVVNTLIPQADVDSVSFEKDELFIKYIDNIQLVEGVWKYMYGLYVGGNPISVVTNCNRKVAEAILKYTNLYYFVDNIVVGNECAYSKPHPDPYVAAIKYYGVSNYRVIIFEDSKSGLLSAKSVNIACIVGVETKYSSRELLEYGANFTLPNYIEFVLDMSAMKKSQNMELLKTQIKECVQYRFDNVIQCVEIDETKLKGGFISDVLMVRLCFENGYTQHCVLKMVNYNQTDLCKMANELKLYDRENLFYEYISKYVNIHIPKYYGLVKNKHFETIGILMEDMMAQPSTSSLTVINLDLNTQPIEVSFRIIDDLAKLHSKFWNNEIALNEFKLLKHNDDAFCPKWKTFMESRWNTFEINWKNTLNESNIQFAKHVIAQFDSIQHYLSSGNLTLIHGDVKSPNIFYRGPTKIPYFIDWQYVAMGKGVQDVVFFLIESFDLAHIKIYYPLFIHYYYVKLKEYGILYDYDEYERDVKYALCHFPFFVAMWFGTVPQDELIDKNFPYFFIQKVFYLYKIVFG
jgi:beta-phosphoglucomutase